MPVSRESLMIGPRAFTESEMFGWSPISRKKFSSPKISRYSSAIRFASLGHFSAQARGEADQSLAEFPENLFVDARLVVKSFEMRLGDELDQVVPAGIVFREEDEVVVSFACFFAEPVARRDVRFNAQDRLHARLLRLFIKLYGAVEYAVVGQGKRVHPQLLRAREKRVNFRQSVEQRIVGVRMEMDELWHKGASCLTASIVHEIFRAWQWALSPHLQIFSISVE